MKAHIGRNLRRLRAFRCQQLQTWRKRRLVGHKYKITRYAAVVVQQMGLLHIVRYDIGQELLAACKCIANATLRTGKKHQCNLAYVATHFNSPIPMRFAQRPQQPQAAPKAAPTLSIFDPRRLKGFQD